MNNEFITVPVEKATGFIQLGNAIIPCNATINTDPSFDSSLVATVGEEVYYLNPNWQLDDYGLVALQVEMAKIEKCKVIKIDYATGCSTCFKALTEHAEVVGGVQELFFRSLEEAMEVANRVNAYSASHTRWEAKDCSGDSWYEIYMKLFKAKYPYVLQFPVKPQQAWLIEEDGTAHIANRVIAYISEQEVSIEYQGRNVKSWEQGKKIMELINSDWMGDEAYRIVPVLSKHQSIIEC